MKDHPSQWIPSGLTCRDVAEQATDYLENRLPVFTKIRVGLHVASCAGCRSYVVQIGRVSSALRSLPKLYPSPVNHLRLRQQFAAHHGPSASGN
jgi:predicted anti-sigma-YlaC factor YlaD